MVKKKKKKAQANELLPQGERCCGSAIPPPQKRTWEKAAKVVQETVTKRKRLKRKNVQHLYKYNSYNQSVVCSRKLIICSRSRVVTLGSLLSSCFNIKTTCA